MSAGFLSVIIGLCKFGLLDVSTNIHAFGIFDVSFWTGTAWLQSVDPRFCDSGKCLVDEILFTPWLSAICLRTLSVGFVAVCLGLREHRLFNFTAIFRPSWIYALSLRLSTSRVFVVGAGFLQLWFLTFCAKLCACRLIGFGLWLATTRLFVVGAGLCALGILVVFAILIAFGLFLVTLRHVSPGLVVVVARLCALGQFDVNAKLLPLGLRFVRLWRSPSRVDAVDPGLYTGGFVAVPACVRTSWLLNLCVWCKQDGKHFVGARLSPSRFLLVVA